MSDRQQSLVMLERHTESYGKGIPYLADTNVKGKLIVIEGPSGRSGHAVLNTGLRRSELISQGILEAKRNLVLGKRTISLFYAADFADQLENKIIPALHSGYIVLADRYIYTLMARDAVRGISTTWSHGDCSPGWHVHSKTALSR